MHISGRYVKSFAFGDDENCEKPDREELLSSSRPRFVDSAKHKSMSSDMLTF